MTGFNLPPGCRVSDIPGNRPEDDENEAFWELVDVKAAELGIVGFDSSDGPMNALIQYVRDTVYTQGFEDGRAEEQMAQAAVEMDKAQAAYEADERLM